MSKFLKWLITFLFYKSFSQAAEYTLNKLKRIIYVRNLKNSLVYFYYF